MKRDKSKYVGVVGLGIMGGAISKNLIDSGFKVFGFDIDLNQQNKAKLFGVDMNISVDVPISPPLCPSRYLPFEFL